MSINNRLEEFLEKGLENKIERLQEKNKFSKIVFEEEEWLIHTTDPAIQKSLTDYLNAHNWDGEMKIIFYLDNHLTCFPIITREMFDWVKKNISHTLYDFLHKRKKSYGEYQKLKPITELK